MTQTTINEKGVLITPTMKKYAVIIKTGYIDEREIISMRSFMHKSKENARFIFDAMNEFREKNQDGNLSLSADQSQKGYDFLMNVWKTPRGIERKNSPFGYREQAILENFSRFELKDFYNAGNTHHDFYLPLYECISKDGNSFEYYYNGKVNIVG